MEGEVEVSNLLFELVQWALVAIGIAWLYAMAVTEISTWLRNEPQWRRRWTNLRRWWRAEEDA